MPPIGRRGDLNGDHVVNALDVALVVTQWDTNAPYTPQYSYTPTFNYILIATPEPASLAMLAVGMMVLAAKAAGPLISWVILYS